jgi:SET domain-containing protein
MYDKEKARNYYQKNKAHILQVHQAWAKKNVDQGGSVWRRYGRRARIKNPNLDKEYYARHREEILYKKKLYYRKKEGLMYKPLPSSLTIKESGIDGLGLFAKRGIAQGDNLGMSHVEIGSGIIRTPMGGFINHSNDANTVKVELRIDEKDDGLLKVATKKWNLIALRDIKEGEELTVRYTFYNV